MAKSDLVIHYGELLRVLNKIRKTKEELQEFKDASKKFRDIISEQEGKSVEKLVKLYDKKLYRQQEDFLNKLIFVEENLDGFIGESTYYVYPNHEESNMRVDQYDILANLKQIQSNICVLERLQREDLNESYADYWDNYTNHAYYSYENRDDELREIEVECYREKARRERNYNKLRNAFSLAANSDYTELSDDYKFMKNIYDTSIVPFANADNRYYYLLLAQYLQWAAPKDRINILTGFESRMSQGKWNSIKDFVTSPAFIITKENTSQTIEGFKALFEDPEQSFEQISQNISDTVDSKGIAHAIGYVATDIALGLLIDKGTNKLLKAGKLSGKIDDVGDIANHADDLLDSNEVKLLEPSLEQKNQKCLENYYSKARGELSSAQKSLLTNEMKLDYDAALKMDRGDILVPENAKDISNIYFNKSSQRYDVGYNWGEIDTVPETREMKVLHSGEQFDRVGSPNGKCVGAVSEDGSYASRAQRSIPYHLNEADIIDEPSYHRYVAEQDFTRENLHKAIDDSVYSDASKLELHQQVNTYYSRSNLKYGEGDGLAYGEIAPMFEDTTGSTGGGYQYDMPLNMENLKNIGMISEVPRSDF